MRRLLAVSTSVVLTVALVGATAAQEEPSGSSPVVSEASEMDAGADGTIWIYFGNDRLARHDDDGWAEFELPTGLRGIQAAPDGSVWSATCDWSSTGCELLRFDGQQWSRYLGSLGLGDIDEIAFAPDGTTWTISGPNALYAILPEAIEG